MSQIPFARPKFTAPVAAPVDRNAKSLMARLAADSETSLLSMRIHRCRKGLFAKRSNKGVFLRKFWKIQQHTGRAELCIDWAARVWHLLNYHSNISWIEWHDPDGNRLITNGWGSELANRNHLALRMFPMALELQWARHNKAAEKSAESEAELPECIEACAADRAKKCA